MDEASLISKAWPNWTTVQLIGQGTYGTVYHVRHRDVADLEAAVKVIPIPNSESEIESLRREGFSEQDINEYFRKMAEDWSREILMMKKYQGMSHFVSIEDCKIIDREDGQIGKWILIRMEKLKSFISYISDKTLTEKEVIELGLQICQALTVCHSDGILHRDIKLDNIFVNDRSTSGILYKLGDFGTSRKIENVTSSLSIKGALAYMAPEIIQGKAYDQRVDIYSLGITLYKLMNCNRLPFLPARQLFTYEDHAVALRMRLNGTPIPPAANASPGLQQVLSKACAYEPSQRYRSAQEFARDLERVMAGKKIRHFHRPDFMENKNVRRICIWLGVAAAAACLIFGAMKLHGNRNQLPAPQPEETPIPMLTVIRKDTP